MVKSDHRFLLNDTFLNLQMKVSIMISDKPRILYVDDEVENLTAFKAVFRRIYDIDIANSAQEGLEILSQNEYDIVISDQRMPKMTGVQFFEIIQSKYPDSIRMVLTGYSDMNAIIDAINKGKVFHYVSKPWNADELKVIINNALEYRRLKSLNEQLEKEKILSQFEILKNQVNPHFLFNSMNVLTSLIRRDSEKAIQFTSTFSKVYRTLLQLKTEDLILLDEELDLVKSYVSLQEVRFEDALTFEIKLTSDTSGYLIAPFAIQLSVENALKHNVVSSKKPLHISVELLNDNIIIRNNLQQRMDTAEHSTGMGLKNIKSRYALLGANEPLFESSESEYKVTLPLITEA